MMELEKTLFGKHHMGKSLMRNSIYRLRASPHKICINNKNLADTS